MYDPKGIDGEAGEAVLYCGKNLTAPSLWSHRSIELDDYSKIQALPWTRVDAVSVAATPSSSFAPTFFK